MVHLDPGRLENRCHESNEAGGVDLLVINDHHGLRVQVVDDVVGVVHTLHMVVRYDPEEGRVLALGERHVGRRPGDERHCGPGEQRTDRLDLLAASRPDDGQDIGVRGELLGGGRRLLRVKLRVTLDERDLGLVLLVIQREGQLREMQLFLAEHGHGTGNRSLDPDRGFARLAATAGGRAATATAASGRDECAERRRGNNVASFHGRCLQFPQYEILGVKGQEPVSRLASSVISVPARAREIVQFFACPARSANASVTSAVVRSSRAG